MPLPVNVMGVSYFPLKGDQSVSESGRDLAVAAQPLGSTGNVYLPSPHERVPGGVAAQIHGFEYIWPVLSTRKFITLTPTESIKLNEIND